MGHGLASFAWPGKNREPQSLTLPVRRRRPVSLTLLFNHSKGFVMDMPSLQRFAPPAVTALVAFLAFSSQWLFSKTEPGPLRKGDAYAFNTLVTSLLICYWRACFTDPGRIPKDWHEPFLDKDNDKQAAQRQRWCRKCDAFKPPRAHHCKTCKRYEDKTWCIAYANAH